MCNVNDPRILNAYIAITEDEPTDWLLLGYKDTRDYISLYASGVNGLSEFRQHITNEILFGFVRVDDRFILITYVPDSVSGVRRARALVHSKSVANVLELSHAQFTASTLNDMSDANIRTRLKLGEKQVPNRPRSALSNNTTTKRTSVMARRRKSGQYPISPSPSPSPSPMSERNLRILTTPTNEEPYEYDTTAPSTPTSVASSFAESSISTINDFVAEIDEKRRQDATEQLLQLQLAKKKELEEARFRQFQRDQQEERFKRDEAIKRLEREQAPLKKTFEKPVLRKVSSILEQKKPIATTNKFDTVLRRSTLNQSSNTVNKFDTVLKRTSILIDQKLPNTTAYKSDTLLKKVPTITAAASEIEPTKIESKPEKIIEIIPSAAAESAVVKEAEEKVLLTGFSSVQTKTSPFWKRRYFIIKEKSMCIYKDEMAKEPISNIQLSIVKRLAPANEDEDTYVPNSFVMETSDEQYQLFADDKKTIKHIYSLLKSLV